jgi:class 3 adenylate cyclase
MPTSLETRLQQQSRLDLFSPDEARVGYEALLAEFPGDLALKVQFAWYLSDLGDHEAAMALARQALAAAPGYLPARFVLSFGSSSHGDYEAAVEEFAGLFAAATPKQLPDGPYMYFCFVVMKKCGFDHAEASRYLEALFARHPALVTNGTREVLLGMLESRLKQIYVQDKKISGFLLFIDLVNSTQYKRDYPDLWPDRIVHFLMYTKYALRTVGFDFIKFIGDEVMLFLPFGEKVDKASVALEVYRFIFSRKSWYLEEVNRFNPTLGGGAHPTSSPHRIKVKMTLGEVTNAKVFNPYYDETYDLIGKDVDRIARIKEMGHEDLVIADEGFYRALSENGPAFAEVLSELRWRQKFKGIDEEVRFYGKPLR